jgi:hypothetical protein
MEGSGKLGSIVTQCLYALNDPARSVHQTKQLGFAASPAKMASSANCAKYQRPIVLPQFGGGSRMIGLDMPNKIL